MTASDSMTSEPSTGPVDASMPDVAILALVPADGTGGATVLVLGIVAATLLDPRAADVFVTGCWRSRGDPVSSVFDGDGFGTGIGAVASAVGPNPSVAELCFSAPMSSAADTPRFGAFGLGAFGFSGVSLELGAPPVTPVPAAPSAAFSMRGGLGVLVLFVFGWAPAVPDVDPAEVVWPDDGVEVEVVPVASAQATPGLMAAAAPSASPKATQLTRPA
ncbi:MAG: hypothetical protein ABW001_11560 [Mycobacterium sp.]